ncbi:RNA polymerase sigma factor [Bacillus sp. FJAT-49736]|uniref:RNA polymerase sigma factor n=1 Tax=Bacillus sp. FJAT-49736 TaxID=2833582 RepID=UPI001BC943FA|nr:RNA polymerase sigma factor [Bacillus sp. FJAT-49736]
MDKERIIEDLFQKYNSYIYHFLVYYTQSTDVEDLVQECFLKALKGIQHFEGKADPKTWLVSIARRVAIDHHRRKKRLLYLPENILPLIPSNQLHLEEYLIQKEEIQQIYKAINEMKRKDREVLILRGIMDLSVLETAEVLGWTKNKVNVTLHRALKKLQIQSKEWKEERDYGIQ